MSPLRWILQERPHAGGRVESKAGAVTSFQDEELSKAIPYGIYDLRANAGWVSVGSITTPRSSRSPTAAAAKEFWIEKPKPHSETLTVYALLDSPSAAGAYRFLIHPGIDLSMEVKARVFLRQGVRRMGVAPLTSMFFHGEHGDRRFDDSRPEVHDSDGLLIAMHSGEWLWRPLNNPRKVATSVFAGEDIAGFGLMQRDRIFDHYQDLTSMYHARPSAWVEPLGRWGPGSLYLIEIPSDAEFYDNIVAFFCTGGIDRCRPGMVFQLSPGLPPQQFAGATRRQSRFHAHGRLGHGPARQQQAQVRRRFRHRSPGFPKPRGKGRAGPECFLSGRIIKPEM